MSQFNNIPELFLTSSERWPNHVVFRHIVEGKVAELRYRELSIWTGKCAGALWAKGVRAGDYVGICADNSPKWVIACVGALSLGAIVVPFDARSRAGEILPIIKQVDPRLILFGEKQYVQTRKEIPDSCAHLLDRLFDADQPVPQLKSSSREDPALVVFTSGTSGASKGVVLTHGNIISNNIAVEDAFPVSVDDRFLSVLPLSHMLEFTAGMIVPINKGATIVYSQLKGPRHLKELLKIERISILVATPVVFQSISDDIESRLEKLPKPAQANISIMRPLILQNPELGQLLLKGLHRELGGKIKYWISGGASTSAELVSSLRSLGIWVLTGYGLTEAAPIVTANTKKNNKTGSAGRPVAGTKVKIINPDASGSGEILVQGPNVMQGYWNNPEATEAAMEDGWLHTGDSGFIDRDGHLHITGRIKSVIVTAGGYNVYPEELEQALAKSRLIKEICVFGKPGQRGEEVCALICPQESLACLPERDERLKTEINTALKNLADYKRLSSYQIYEKELPRTPSGKIRRGEVLRLFEQAQSLRTSSRKPEDGRSALSADELKVHELIGATIDPDILQKVSAGTRIFARDLNLSGELGLDSFSRLELACRLEQEFSISVPENAIQEALTVSDIVTLVRFRTELADIPANNAKKTEAIQCWPGDWQPWPVAYCEPTTWPLRDDPFVRGGRIAIDLFLQIAIRVYNQFKTVGAEHLRMKPPYIVAANHTSHLDFLAILASFPQELLPIVHPVAAADYFFADKVKSALSTYLLNAVPFDRFGRFEESMKTCEELLRSGHILVIFPEGTRSADGKIASFKPGVAHLSMTVGCSIIPAYIKGAHEILPKGSLMPKPCPLSVSFGPPLQPPLAEPNVRTCQELTRKLREAVIALK
jgi:long-chain acyl-CoA synthetase